MFWYKSYLQKSVSGEMCPSFSCPQFKDKNNGYFISCSTHCKSLASFPPTRLALRVIIKIISFRLQVFLMGSDSACLYVCNRKEKKKLMHIQAQHLKQIFLSDLLWKGIHNQSGGKPVSPWMLNKKAKCKTNNVFVPCSEARCFVRSMCYTHTQEWFPSWSVKRKTESSLHSKTVTPLWVGGSLVNNPQWSWILPSKSINSHSVWMSP